MGQKSLHLLATGQLHYDDGTELDGFAIDMYLRERMETLSGIYNHDNGFDPSNPLPLVTVNPLSDVASVNPIAHETARLIANNVPEKLNMSILDILNMDTSVYTLVVDEAIRDYMVKDVEANSELFEKFKDEVMKK